MLNYVLTIDEEISLARAREIRELLEKETDSSVRINRSKKEIQISTEERLEVIFELLEKNDVFVMDAELQ